VNENLENATEILLASVSEDLVKARDDAYPNEAVGILCYDGAVYPLINQARSPHRFEVGETLVGEAINHLKHRGKMPVAVYHSHPTSGSGPSARDEMMMQEMPGAVFVIVGANDMAAWMWEDELRCIGKVALEE